MAGGGLLGLGFVLDGGGGAFCSGAPPGCELGAFAGGAVWSLAGGGLFGVVVSLGGELAEPLPLFELPLPPHAAAESESAATHSNNKLRFIRITSQGNRRTEARRRKPRSTSGRRPSPGDPGSAGYFLAARFFFLTGSLARDLPKEPR